MPGQAKDVLTHRVERFLDIPTGALDGRILLPGRLHCILDLQVGCVGSTRVTKGVLILVRHPMVFDRLHDTAYN